MSLIDTRGPAEFFLRGRGMAQQEQAQQQQVRENAARMAQQASQFDQRHALDLQQFELQRQAQMRKEVEDAAIAEAYRAELRPLVPPRMLPPGGVGPVQNDDYEPFRVAIEKGGVPVLRELAKIIPNRTKLDSMRKMLPVLKQQREMIAPGSPERIILDQIVNYGDLGDTEGFEKAVLARVQAQTKAAEENAQLRTLAQDMSTQFGIPLEEAMRRVRLTKGNVINEGQNQTARTRMLSEAAIQGSTEYKRAKLGLDRVQRHIDEIEASMADPSLNPSGRKLLTQMLNAAREQERQAEDAIIEVYAKQRGETGGQPAPMAQPAQPPTQTAAPVAPPAAQGPPIDIQVQVIQQLTKQLGREPTDDEIDAAMGAL